MTTNFSMGFTLLMLIGCASLPNAKKVSLATGKVNVATATGSSPTLVFQSGLGDGMSTWSGIIQKLPNQSYVAYDRFGYGGSSSAIADRSPCRQADELHELLHKAKIQAPFLLVGHSLGGLYQYVFALKYPDEVAGMLLLDPTHPEHWKNIQSNTKVAAGIISFSRVVMFTPAMRAEFASQAACMDELRNKELSPKISRSTLLAVSTLVKPGEGGEYQKLLSEERNDWLKLLAIQSRTSVAGAGHYIHSDQPDEVARLISMLMTSSYE